MTRNILDLYALKEALSQAYREQLAHDRRKAGEILKDLQEVTKTTLRMEIIATRMEG